MLIINRLIYRTSLKFNAINCETFYISSSCKKLTEILIGDRVKKIPSQFAYGLKSIEAIVIPACVESIGEYAFRGCSNLTSIQVYSSNPVNITLGSSVFYEVNKNTCKLYVPTGSLELYAAASQWKDFMNINEFVREVALTDGNEYTQSVDMPNCSVSYTRNFTSDAWQALYIPFSMEYEDWKDVAEVAYINNVHQWDDDNDGVVDRTVLEFIRKKSGAIEANKPYVIKPKEMGEVTFTSENTTLYATPETDGFVDCMSTTAKYILYGTYQEKTDMFVKGYYGMSGGNFMLADDANVTLPPFRTYLKIESRNGYGAAAKSPKRVSVMVDGIIDNETTEIQAVEDGYTSGAPMQQYNLSGQKVGTNYKGIVIRNGKKTILK